MLKKPLFIFSILIVLAALVLAACTPSATPVSEEEAMPEPTEEVLEEELPEATEEVLEEESPEATEEEASEPASWRDTDPYKPFPETISMVLVKGGQESASSLPEGETIEDNQALQYIEDTLNIDITFSWIVSSDSYTDKLNLAITSGDIPDVMTVDLLQLEQLAAADAIEDLTPILKNMPTRISWRTMPKQTGLLLLQQP